MVNLTGVSNYIDLKTTNVDKYKEILKTTEFIPSWKALEENIDKNLDIKKNINNLDELLIALKTKQNSGFF